MRQVEPPLKGSVVQDQSCLMIGSCKEFPLPSPKARGQGVRTEACCPGKMAHPGLVAKSRRTGITPSGGI